MYPLIPLVLYVGAKTTCLLSLTYLRFIPFLDTLMWMKMKRNLLEVKPVKRIDPDVKPEKKFDPEVKPVEED